VNRRHTQSHISTHQGTKRDPPYENQTRKISTITINPVGKNEHMKNPGKPHFAITNKTLGYMSRLIQEIKIIRIIISNCPGCNFKSFS
jgi:hypothetical protein